MEDLNKKRQALLKLLNDDNPDLDIPYVYMEKLYRQLMTGRTYRYSKNVPGPDRAIPLLKELVNEGTETGKLHYIYITDEIVTERELRINELLRNRITYDYNNLIKVDLGKEGNGEDEGNAIFVKALNRQEATDYEQYIPETTKEKLRLRAEEIMNLKNNKGLGLNKKVFLGEELSRHFCPHIEDRPLVVKTTEKKAILARQPYVDKKRLQELIGNKGYRDLMEINNLDSKISLKSIKNAIQKHKKIEREDER